jgi:hypothetical protein
MSVVLPEDSGPKISTGWNHVNFGLGAGIPESHNAAFAVAFGNGGDGRIQLAGARSGGFGFRGGFIGSFRRHKFGAVSLLVVRTKILVK